MAIFALSESVHITKASKASVRIRLVDQRVLCESIPDFMQNYLTVSLTVVKGYCVNMMVKKCPWHAPNVPFCKPCTAEQLPNNKNHITSPKFGLGRGPRGPRLPSFHEPFWRSNHMKSALLYKTFNIVTLSRSAAFCAHSSSRQP